jgi:hypothetical protein
MKNNSANAIPVLIRPAVDADAAALDKRVVPPRAVRDVKHGRTLHLPGSPKT